MGKRSRRGRKKTKVTRLRDIKLSPTRRRVLPMVYRKPSRTLTIKRQSPTVKAFDRRREENRLNFWKVDGKPTYPTKQKDDRYVEEKGRQYYFQDPKNTLVCRRRSRRRKTLFRKQKIGSGIRIRKKTYNETSNIVCRRA